MPELKRAEVGKLQPAKRMARERSRQGQRETLLSLLAKAGEYLEKLNSFKKQPPTTTQHLKTHHVGHSSNPSTWEAEAAGSF